MDPRAAAAHYVLYRLAQLGCEAELATNPHADVVACSREGTRVALLRIRVRSAGGWSMHATDAAGDARNRAHVFVDFGTVCGGVALGVAEVAEPARSARGAEVPRAANVPRVTRLVRATNATATCFVVPAAVVAAELRKSRAWPGQGTRELEAYREAWHLLALSRKSSSRSAPVASPSSPTA